MKWQQGKKILNKSNFIKAIRLIQFKCLDGTHVSQHFPALDTREKNHARTAKEVVLTFYVPRTTKLKHFWQVF
jgi:hypothetical protein